MFMETSNLLNHHEAKLDRNDKILPFQVSELVNGHEGAKYSSGEG